MYTNNKAQNTGSGVGTRTTPTNINVVPVGSASTFIDQTQGQPSGCERVLDKLSSLVERTGDLNDYTIGKLKPIGVFEPSEDEDAHVVPQSGGVSEVFRLMLDRLDQIETNINLIRKTIVAVDL